MEGIDISAYNRLIDWGILKSSGRADFVYIKSSEGVHTIDRMGSIHADNAKKAGVPFGYYHFCHPELYDAKTEASAFLAALSHLPGPGLIPVMDMEYSYDKAGNKVPIGKDVASWILEFIGYMNGPVMIYTSPDYVNNELRGHKLGRYPLWLANYSNSAHLPAGWSKYQLWQYGKGAVAGIKGEVDVDRGEIIFL